MAVLVVAVLLVVLVSLDRDGNVSGSPASDGPLTLGAGGYRIVFGESGPRAQVTRLGGGILPCTRDGEVATVTEVRVRSAVETTQVDVYVRRIPDIAARTPGPALDWAPITGLSGRVASLTARGHLRGRMAELVPGETFGLRCQGQPRDPHLPMDEVILEVTADKHGALIDGVDVDYTVGSTAYTTSIGVTVVICGTRVDRYRYCHGEPG